MLIGAPCCHATLQRLQDQGLRHSAARLRWAVARIRHVSRR
jgi:hypothetical protein